MATNAVSVRVLAPAKVNLFLRILAKEESGYHQIETLYSAVDFCDEIVLHRTERGVSVEVVGPSVGPEDENLAYRAADALLDAAGVTTGVHVCLTKNIPVGAGLGGGSSDAGATLRGSQQVTRRAVFGVGAPPDRGTTGGGRAFFRVRCRRCARVGEGGASAADS